MKNEISTGGLILSLTARFTRLTGKTIERRLKPIGLSLQEMRIAGLLMGEDALTQKALAEKLSVKPATLSVAISKLEKQGLVKRIANTVDKRVNFLRLATSKKYAKVDDVLIDLENKLCKGISASDIKTTRRVLTQLLKNAEQLNQEQGN